MKLSIANEPREPELSLSLRRDDKQITLVGQTNDGSLNNHLAWVTEDGRFVVNETAAQRIGLTLVHYTGTKF